VNKTAPPSRESSTYIDGIVLAAGRSQRMGRPKALLPIDDETFVERAIVVLRDGGCRGVVAVVGRDDPEAARRAEAAGAKVVASGDPDTPQADSLRLGLAAIGEDAAAAVVLPVDHPLVQATTVLALIREFRSRGGAPAAIRPVYCGVTGHPTLFGRRIFAELAAPDLPEGARSVLAAHTDAVVDLPVEDGGVTADIDTPDDYRRLVGGSC
jgi:CTP:molybdopterin cytidylyltransferase MocA